MVIGVVLEACVRILVWSMGVVKLTAMEKSRPRITEWLRCTISGKRYLSAIGVVQLEWNISGCGTAALWELRTWTNWGNPALLRVGVSNGNVIVSFTFLNYKDSESVSSCSEM